MNESARRPLFSTNLQRVEVGIFPASGRDEGTVWNVHVHGIGADEETDHPFVILTGYLSSNGQEGFGQARVAGLLFDRDIEREVSDEARLNAFMLEIDEMYLEPMYDTARRALQSQAAQMDFHLELDVQAPTAKIHLPMIDDVDVEDDE